MPINAHPDFVRAEQEYHNAETKQQKINALKKMISLAPSHKGAENLRSQLKRRLARLKYTNEKETKQKKYSKVGIKKEDMQIVLIGKTNSGKSSLLNTFTNASPKISVIEFTTSEPVIGMMNLEGINMQLIENPATNSEMFDKGLANSADTIIILVDKIEDIKDIENILQKSLAKKIIAINKIDRLSDNEKRKLKAKLQSKKYNFVLVSTKTKEGLHELKNKIFQSFDKIRIYTKEPGKEKSPKPIIMKQDSTVFDVAEKILKGFSKTVAETKIWGPSSKFSGQKVGLKHKLKDLDVVEFKTR